MEEYKIGDKAIVMNGSRSGEPYKIVAVIKVTATRIETSDGQQFMRRSGNLVGGSGWYSDNLGNIGIDEAKKRNAEWHFEHDAKIRRNNLAGTNWRDVPDEKIIRIQAILNNKE